MEIDEYLALVAKKVKEAKEKKDYEEVIRLLDLCTETLDKKLDELSRSLEEDKEQI